MKNTNEEIPVINLSGLRSGNRMALDRIAHEIGAAARGIGFFSIANHGIAQSLIEAVLAESERFFALPGGRENAHPRDRGLCLSRLFTDW